MSAIKKPRWFTTLQQQTLDLKGQQLRVGVTGLSRAGKTTFITSLINQLENHQRGLLARRPPFDRLEAVRWQREGVEQPFAYLEALAALSSDPARWPASTTDLSRVVIDLRFRQTGVLKRVQQSRSVRVEILDYPGEWLLDLPLLELDYGQWCEQMREWLDAEPRRSLAGSLRDELAAIDPLAQQNAEQLQRLTASWVEFLQRSRREAGLSRNQPGRFLLPGSGVAAEMLLFVPLLAGNRHTRVGAGSWWAESEARFRYYRDFVVKGFYDEHFSRLDRQILLVDMLTPMDAGQAALADLKSALESVLQSFRYGRNSVWRRFWQPRISRLAVCATKVDQVTPEQQRAVQQCLEDLLTDSLSDVRHGGVQVRGFPLAALRATRQEGDTLVAGLDGQSGWVRYQPGEIPAHLPLDLQVDGPALLNLRPPTGLHRNEPFPHYRMDELVGWIVEGLKV